MGRRVLGFVLEGLDHDRFNLVIADLARRARARLIEEAIESFLDEPAPPQPHRRRRTRDLGRDLDVRLIRRARQHDPGPAGQTLRAVTAGHVPSERLALFISQYQWCFGSPGSVHARSERTRHRENSSS
jgi:hypothetical protein